MEKLLTVAKEILDLNPTAILTGTLMLKLRGIDLGREPHDIDILLRDYATTIILPSSLYSHVENSTSSDESCSKFSYDDINIDVMSSNEDFDIVDGYRLAKVENLLKVKCLYSKQDNINAKKHIDDIITILYAGLCFNKVHFT